MSGARGPSAGTRVHTGSESMARAGLWALAGVVESTGWCYFEVKAMRKL